MSKVKKIIFSAIVLGALTPVVPVFATSLSFGGGTGGGVSGGGGGNTGSTGSTGNPSTGYSNVLTSQTVSTSGGKLTATVGNTNVSLNIPSGAFNTSETVTLTQNATKASIASILPKNDSFITEIGVSFSGSNPTVPVTLTIYNNSIPANGEVFKLGLNDQLIPVNATVTKGKVVITFASDPSFVILAPNSSTTPQASIPSYIPKGQRLIVMGNQYRFVPGLVYQSTTYMPIWYISQMLKTVGVNSTWNGHDWDLTTNLSVNLSDIQAGQGTMSMYLNGRLVQHVTGIVSKDPFSGHMTTYMPIWYVMKVLNRMGVSSTWNGHVWDLK